MRSAWIDTVDFLVLAIEYVFVLCLMVVADLIGCEFLLGWKECVELVSTIALYELLLEHGGIGSLSLGIDAGIGCGQL